MFGGIIGYREKAGGKRRFRTDGIRYRRWLLRHWLSVVKRAYLSPVFFDDIAAWFNFEFGKLSYVELGVFFNETTGEEIWSFGE